VSTINEKDYRAAFSGRGGEALKQALDIRKFEIDLYWKRSAYFWAFNAAAFAGYAAQAQSQNSAQAPDLLVIIASFGLVLSVAWYLVNRGSKQWQQNWEYHVDMLEDCVTGPLYKIVIKQPKPYNVKGYFKYYITGPGSFSVCKINMIVSLFAVALWLGLIFRAMPPLALKVALSYISPLVAFAAIALTVSLGRTSEEDDKGEAKETFYLLRR
jgi:hypothetical protein